jgi:hypothetical protein
MEANVENMSIRAFSTTKSQSWEECGCHNKIRISLKRLALLITAGSVGLIMVCGKPSWFPLDRVESLENLFLSICMIVLFVSSNQVRSLPVMANQTSKFSTRVFSQPPIESFRCVDLPHHCDILRCKHNNSFKSLN